MYTYQTNQPKEKSPTANSGAYRLRLLLSEHSPSLSIRVVIDVFFCLADWKNLYTKPVKISLATLAKRAGIARSTAQIAIKWLEEQKILTVTRTFDKRGYKGINWYTLNPFGVLQAIADSKRSPEYFGFVQFEEEADPSKEEAKRKDSTHEEASAKRKDSAPEKTSAKRKDSTHEEASFKGSKPNQEQTQPEKATSFTELYSEGYQPFDPDVVIPPEERAKPKELTPEERARDSARLQKMIDLLKEDKPPPLSRADYFKKREEEMRKQLEEIEAKPKRWVNQSRPKKGSKPDLFTACLAIVATPATRVASSEHRQKDIELLQTEEATRKESSPKKPIEDPFPISPIKGARQDE